MEDPRTSTLELVACPDPTCDAIAEIADRITLTSTSGAVETVKTRCLRRHIFILDADGLERADV
jgi:hypothetical protein